MDGLERYLEQVCRSIGGPRAMREHVRQELREHLLDAVAQHKAAGLPDEQAIAQALAEFGKPDELRSEMEATHGHRMLASVIDSVMQWKETTMRAKWLWTTWAHLALVAVVAMEVFFISFTLMYIVPRYQKLTSDGMIDVWMLEEQGVTWMADFLTGMTVVRDRFTTFILIGVAALWGLFEWRVRSENKSFMRLSALGTAAVGLMVVVVLTAGSMLVCFTLAMPAMGRMAQPFALEQVSTFDSSIAALEKALAKDDWNAAGVQAELASGALHRLAHGPALNALTATGEGLTTVELRKNVKSAHQKLNAARLALEAKDAARANSDLVEVRHSFGPVREASKRITRK